MQLSIFDAQLSLRIVLYSVEPNQMNGLYLLGQMWSFLGFSLRNSQSCKKQCDAEGYCDTSEFHARLLSQTYKTALSEHAQAGRKHHRQADHSSRQPPHRELLVSFPRQVAMKLGARFPELPRRPASLPEN